MAITETHAATTGIGATEWSLTTDTASPQTQTNDACVQVFLDLSALTTGDKYRFRIYEKVRSTGQQRVVSQHTFANKLARPIWASPTLILLHGWDVTLQKLAGVDRAIDFSVREMTQTGGSGSAPTIDSFAPLSGDAADIVTITGTNFTGATGVKFGTTPSSLVILNDTTIQTTVPLGMSPGAYTITVDTFGNSVTSSTTFYVATFSGLVTLTSDYVQSSGVVEWDPFVTTTVTMDNKHFIVEGGTVRMNPSAAGIVHTLKFINVDESQFVGGGAPTTAAEILSLPALVNDKGFWCVGAGTMDLEGTNKQTWTRATSGLSAGATSCDIPAGHGWQVGDEVVFVPTAPGTQAAQTHSQYDEKTLTSVAGNTIGFSALAFAHPAVTPPNTATLNPEILNMSNNVRIEGTSGHKTHLFISNNVNVSHTLKNISVRHTGPRKAGFRVLGRWPVHHHHSDNHLAGLVNENITVRDSGSFAFVAHETHNVEWKRCVGHNNQESQFWWDHDVVGDISNNITYTECFASKTLPGDPGEGTSQARLGAFYLTRNGDGHAIRRCIAVGTSQSAGKNSSGFIWPEIDTTGPGNPPRPTNPGLWIFEDCIAHNNGNLGAFVWQNNGPLPQPNYVRFLTYHNGRAGMQYGAYNNSVTHDHWIGYKDGYLTANEAPFSLISNAHRAPTGAELIYDHIILDGGGAPQYSILLTDAKVFSDVLFLQPVFKGYTVNVIQIDNTTILTFESGHNFSHRYVGAQVGATGRDLEPSDLTFLNANPDDIIRVQRQNGLTAWQWLMTAGGPVVTSIPPFYP